MAKYTIEEGDRLMEFAQKPLKSALADGTASEILKNTFEALHKQSMILSKVNYDEVSKEITCPKCAAKFWQLFPIPFDLIAKSMAYTAKVGDELTRLLSFMQGGPDSRPDLGAGAIYEALTDEQLEQLRGWVMANKREKEEKEGLLQ